MHKLAVLICAGMIAGAASETAAQNLLITNARILDGRGGVIERGSIVVRDGKIASVAQGAATAPAGGLAPSGAEGRTIDARGMTVMPGFIDAHRHVIRGDAAQWMKEQSKVRMQEFLDAGFTTVLSAGDSIDEILALRRQTEQGAVRGPRLIVSGRVPLAGPAPGPGGGGGRGGGPAVDPARSDRSREPRTQAAPAIPEADTRAAVRKLKEAGVDAIKTVMIATPGGPEVKTLSVIADEARKQGILSITHAVTVDDTLAAVDARTDILVHTPHIGRLEENPAAVQKIARSGIPMMSTLAIFIPHFDANNTALFRDAMPFPWANLGSGGQGPVNARLLWEAGITYGYGTDTSWHPRESLADELRALHAMFSAKDIVSILTKNAAITIGRGKDLGTLEAGKIADLVIVNGDPLANVTNLLNVVTSIKGGVVVAEKR